MRIAIDAPCCRRMGHFLLTCLLIAAPTSDLAFAQQSPGMGSGLVYNAPVNGEHYDMVFEWAAPAHQWMVDAPGGRRPEIQVAAMSLVPESDEIIPAPSPSLNPTQLPSQPPSQLDDNQKLGQAPEDFSHQFLRQESVLLKCGELQIDVGLNYTVFDHNYTNLAIDQASGDPVVVALDSRVTQRLMLIPLDVRYGVSDTLQAFLDVPFGWSNTQDSYAGHDEFANSTGIGDLTQGVSWLIHKGNGCSYSPDVIATFAYTAPTADVSPLQGILEPPNALLGQGFWYGSWNVLVVHTVDPVVLFYGLGSRHGISREYHGYNILPGDQYSYRFGLGFAVNEKVTLSAIVNGSYITEPKLNGRNVEGLALEPISMRFAATVARPTCMRFWEPFVEIGMTSDAPNVRLGMTFTY